MVDEVENKDYEINSSSVYEDMKKDYSFHGQMINLNQFPISRCLYRYKKQHS